MIAYHPAGYFNVLVIADFSENMSRCTSCNEYLKTAPFLPFLYIEFYD